MSSVEVGEICIKKLYILNILIWK